MDVTLPALAEDWIAAYGGVGYLREVGGMTVDFAASGPAFAMKFRPRALRELRVTVPPSGFDVLVEGLGGRPDDPGHDDSGRSSAGRIRWNDAVLAGFVRAAMWTYVTVPFSLPEHSAWVRELDSWLEGGERLRRIEVDFRSDVPTHCPRQVFYLDEQLRIRRHDYTALAFGGWTHAAHYSSDFTVCDGIPVPMTRRVYPRRPDGRPRAAVALVRIDVNSCATQRSAAAARSA